MAFFTMFNYELTLSVAALGQRILDQWLIYLEPIHVHILKEGDFGVNFELQENLLIVCYCFRSTVGSAMGLTCFINVRY